MTDSLEGKTALVTGASRGIGRAIALKLGSAGATVGLHYAKSAEAAETLAAEIAAAGGRSFPVEAELSTIAGVEAVVAAVKQQCGEGAVLDILVNNAGHQLGDGPNASEAVFDGTFAVNLKAVFFLIQRLAPMLRDGGRIVNISSGLSKKAVPDAMIYGMTKAALNAMTRAHARHFGARNITVNAVLPGLILTDMSRWIAEEPGASMARSRSVFGRIGQPDDVASIVAFLVSDAAGWVTGELIDASGGQFVV